MSTANTDRIDTIRELLTSQCERCGGEGHLGPNYNTRGETCPSCSGLGRIEDDVHDNHLAWCLAEILRLRARDRAWQEKTGLADPSL